MFCVVAYLAIDAEEADVVCFVLFADFAVFEGEFECVEVDWLVGECHKDGIVSNVA